MKFLSKLIITTIFLFVPMFGYSQKDYIEILKRLEQEVSRIEARIRSENDTLKVLKTQIDIIENQHLVSKSEINGSLTLVPTTLRIDGKIRISDDPFSDIIKFVNKNDTVMLTDYKEGYWIVLKGDFSGYLSEIYVNEPKQVITFKNKLKKQNSSRLSSTKQIEEKDVENSANVSTSTNVNTYRSPASNSTIYTGPRGGRYYINSNGNKTYLKSGSSGYGGSRRSNSSYRPSRRR